MCKLFLISLLLGINSMIYAAKVELRIPDRGTLVTIDLDETADFTDTLQEKIDQQPDGYRLALICTTAGYRAYDAQFLAGALVRGRLFQDPANKMPITALYTYRRGKNESFVIDRDYARALLRNLLAGQPPADRTFVREGGDWIDISHHDLEYFRFALVCRMWQQALEHHDMGTVLGGVPFSPRYGVCDRDHDYYGELNEMVWLKEREVEAIITAYSAAFEWNESVRPVGPVAGSSSSASSSREVPVTEPMAGPSARAMPAHEAAASHGAMDEAHRVFALGIMAIYELLEAGQRDEAFDILQGLYHIADDDQQIQIVNMWQENFPDRALIAA